MDEMLVFSNDISNAWLVQIKIKEEWKQFSGVLNLMFEAIFSCGWMQRSQTVVIPNLGYNLGQIKNPDTRQSVS